METCLVISFTNVSVPNSPPFLSHPPSSFAKDWKWNISMEDKGCIEVALKLRKDVINYCSRFVLQLLIWIVPPVLIVLELQLANVRSINQHKDCCHSPVWLAGVRCVESVCLIIGKTLHLETSSEKEVYMMHFEHKQESGKVDLRDNLKVLYKIKSET